MYLNDLTSNINKTYEVNIYPDGGEMYSHPHTSTCKMFNTIKRIITNYYLIIIDADECLLGPCGDDIHNCTNTDPFYTCQCAVGYHLNDTVSEPTCTGKP